MKTKDLARQPDHLKPRPQEFRVTLRVRTECKDRLTERQLKKWVEAQFEGCDVGDVRVTDVIDLNV